MSELLFTPTHLGAVQLKNRVVMAPMTRCRAIDTAPGALEAAYYSQRASAGLIITEGTAPDADGLGYARQPGIFTEAQILGWKQVTDAVHAAGGRIALQLMHGGRVAHPLNMVPGARILGPSAVAAPGQQYTDAQGPQDIPVPEAMTEADIEAAIAGFAQAARNAMTAGFDAVELHGANGYLIEQFLNTAANQRTDQWGGSIENRARFALRVAKATVAAIGSDRVGIRLSPYGVFNGSVPDAETDALYSYLAKGLGNLGLAWLHQVDHVSMGAPAVPESMRYALREGFGGPILLSGGYDKARADADLVEGKGQAVAFGRPFIANPNLVEALQDDRELRQPDYSAFYTPGAKGYSDYPPV